MDEKYEPALEIKKYDLAELRQKPIEKPFLSYPSRSQHHPHPVWAYHKVEEGEGFVIYSEPSRPDGLEQYGVQVNVRDSHGDQLILPTEALATQVCHAVNSAYNSGLTRGRGGHV